MTQTTLAKITSNPDELREFANALERVSFYMMISFKEICALDSIGTVLNHYEDLQLLRDGLLEEYHLSADRHGKKVEV